MMTFALDSELGRQLVDARQFQKRIRLQNARSLLVARPGDVAGIGHLVGYDSPTQFSREYRRLFGAPPGQDAARLRADADPRDIRHLP